MNDMTKKSVIRARTLDAKGAVAVKEQPVQAEEPQPGAVAPTGQGGTLSDMSEYAEYAGHGMQDIGRDEQLIPMFRLLQSNSPQCEEGGPKYIPGAKPGLILNTATNQLYKRMEFIICWRDHNFVEYVPRDAGGGFVGLHDPTDEFIAQLREAQGEFGKLKVNPENDQSNEIQETYYFYGIAFPIGLDDQPLDPIRGVVPFASTQIKKYKMLMTTINGIQLRPPVVKKAIPFPIYAHKWEVSAQPERNKKGAFQGWRLAMVGGNPAAARLSPKDPLFQEAHDFHKLLESGAVTADFGKDTGEHVEDGAGGEDGNFEMRDGKRFDKRTGEEIPF
jgi:hypothetical protein